MKKIIYIVFLSSMMLLSACSGEEKEELTRIDIHEVDAEGNYKEVGTITDSESIELIQKTFNQIKWDNKVVNMARQPDIKLILFYTFDENMPERLIEYEIWFNENTGTSIIVGNKENLSYGELDKDHTNTLRNYLKR
ncbi:hypothetical protein [Oceanobacillus salinisoli]|uniref:hypothetical protein n=1 Tax=Oceanobacillus salinisoli TaxID=2678611 RepID=UPI0012E2A89B|nr:hypothetical protein [Oceanobacillus salinisoli]